MSTMDYLIDTIIKQMRREGMELTVENVVDYAKEIPKLKEGMENPHIVEGLREAAKTHIEHITEVREFSEKAKRY